MNLRERYFAAVKESQRKELISKSATSGPQVYAIKNQAGEIIGFAPGERLSPSEVAALKTDVAKSATAEDPNAVLDSLFDFGGPPAVEVSKSVDANDPNAILDGVFPQWLQAN